MKTFGYPIPFDDLLKFADPRHAVPYEHDGWTYFETESWTLRTRQGVGAPASDTAPVTEFTRAEETRNGWKPFDYITRVLNMYPAEIWHGQNLNFSSLCWIGDHHITKGILQLASRLPNAELLPTFRGASLPVRFTKGMLLIHHVPPHIRNIKPPLIFFQPAI